MLLICDVFWFLLRHNVTYMHNVIITANSQKKRFVVEWNNLYMLLCLICDHFYQPWPIFTKLFRAKNTSQQISFLSNKFSRAPGGAMATIYKMLAGSLFLLSKIICTYRLYELSYVQQGKNCWIDLSSNCSIPVGPVTNI